MSILDWCGVAYAGKKEPVSKIVSEMVMEESGINKATVIGNGHKVSSRGAALANGATGHALDYDDTHFLFCRSSNFKRFTYGLGCGRRTRFFN